MSKLRSDELVNMEGDGAPSFPQGATTIEPTADNQVATKLYVDSALSAASGNAVSDTAPTDPAVGSFWTDTSVSPSLLKTWNGSMWIEFAGTAGAAVGVVVSLPSLSATNLEYAPATITASAAQVSNATLFITKWYKDDVEIVGATGSTYVATEPGVYRYEERWADNAGNVLTPSLNKTIELLAIEAPSITIPVAGTGLSDFDYTAESSAIANVNNVDVSDGDAFGITTYTGNGITKTINTGIDLSGDGGMIWIKARSADEAGVIVDTERGVTKRIYPAAAVAESTDASMVASASSDGFVIGSSNVINTNNVTHVAWSFRKAPGFFDIVTYQGNNLTPQSIPHSLGSVPGVIIARNLDSGQNWAVYHQDFGPDHNGTLNSNVQFWSGSEQWNNNVPTSTEFSVGASGDTNRNTDRHVAYLFADNPSNQIKCGYFSNNTGNFGPPAPSDAVVDCGFQPRFILAKATSTGGWYMMDVERGWSTSGDHQAAYMNASVEAQSANAEVPQEGNFNFNATSTGFEVTYSKPGNWMFIAIGSPQSITSQTQLTLTDTTVSKISDGTVVSGSTIDQVLTVGETVQADTAVTSTVATPVFSATTYAGNGSTQTIDAGIDLDAGGGLIWIKKRGSQNHSLQDTEQGLENFAPSNSSGGFTSSTTRVTGATSTGFTLGNDSDVNANSSDYASWSFREAPAFFDVVTYTGQYTYPASYAVPHSLGSVPGMIIIKQTSGTSGWTVWHKGLSSTTGKALDLHSTFWEDIHSGFFPTAPTADYFYVGDNSNINQQNQSYVAYVFADTPGVIKCGTYTGTGSSQTIDTGFKPKFVLTKSRSHSSDWYLMDSVNSGQALYTNSSNGQQNVDIGYVNNGFTVDGRNLALNEIGYAYIYMAIAEDAEVDITSDIHASGTVSASTGNTITLSDTSGTWSTGMKVQGTDSDTKDYPDPIDASAVTFASSQPVVTSGTVNTWDYAEWNLSYDSQFSSVVHEKAVPLTATGTQAGPDSFPIQAGTEYFVRTKYASFLPSGQSDWSAVTRFLTKANFYVDDVFSTFLYEGNGSTQTINNGIDLSGEGGMVWLKSRTSGWDNVLFDTERDTGKQLKSNSTASELTGGALTQFNSNGFSIDGSGSNYQDGNNNGDTYVSWTFRKAPGFFDVQTFTVSPGSHTINHSLDSTPGMMIIKCTSESGGWYVWNSSIPNKALGLDSINPTTNFVPEYIWGNGSSVVQPTSTQFTMRNNSTTDQTFVCYLFAHDDARFGTNGNESIIKCGSYTGDGSSSGNVIDLGFEPQWLLIKRTSSSDPWILFDNMRGMATGSQDARLEPSESDAEDLFGGVDLLPTGFQLASSTGFQNSSGETYIYMAIRRPHKPPTDATEVYYQQTGVGPYPAGWPVDLWWSVSDRSNPASWDMFLQTRLMGGQPYLRSSSTTAEIVGVDANFDNNNGVPDLLNFTNSINWFFRRAPGFFDVVNYTGTGSARTVSHNLGVNPEFMMVKCRTQNSQWAVYDAINGASKALTLGASGTFTYNPYWNSTAPTATQFTVNTDGAVNDNGQDYAAYLFASLDGISKVGSYNGTGSNVDVDCGFAAGARFILIKRTDTTGDWYVWDTARGIVSGNDPYLLLNSTAAEVTNTDYIDPLNAGFTVTSSAPAALNASGGTYLFLAIA